MTTALVLDVDSSVYYEAGDRLKTLAGEWFFGVDAFWSKLNECGNMTGSYSEAKKWAESYDARAAEALKMVSDIAYATFNYGVVLTQMGYNHAVAEWKAAGSTGAEPQAPAKAFAGYPCRIPLPSAGGPGSGLIDGGVKLIDAIGITVPDGNAELLQRAADTWAAIADAAPVTGMAAGLEAAAARFEAIVSPEASFIDEDIRALKAAAETTARVFRELSGSTRDHHDGLVEMRAKMVELLKELGEELLKELAISVAIAAAASVVTFGIGAAVASARVVSIAAKMGRPIRIVIDAFKTERNIAKGVRVEENVTKHADDVSRLKALRANPPKEYKPPTAKDLGLTDEEYAAISRYTGTGYKDLNAALRSGEITPEQAARARELNAALDKFPNYEGLATRKTYLNADQIERYKEGEDVTEASFTSASRLSESSKYDGNVEFVYLSKTGKPIENTSNYGPWSGQNEGEILFKSDTPFHCVSNKVDPATMRNVIVLVEN